MAIEPSLRHMSVSLGTHSDAWIEQDLGPALPCISCVGLGFLFYKPHGIALRMKLSSITRASSWSP